MVIESSAAGRGEFALRLTPKRLDQQDNDRIKAHTA
jgi:hypothetical protein